MKYISVILLLLLMSWSWCEATSARSNAFARHQDIEEGVQESVRAFIQSRYPTTTDFYCPQLYTENVRNEETLLARFRCKVVGQAGEDDSSEQVFEGFLRLESKDGFQTWTETGGEIRAKEIRFLNGIKISPEKATEKSPESK